jgi:agmatine/peptidylarginine deiminase
MMKRFLWGLCAAWSIGCGPVVDAEPPTRQEPGVGVLRQGPGIRPSLSRAPDARLEAMADPTRSYAWQCFPQRYGFTPSFDGVRFPSEHESDGGLLLGWPFETCAYPEQLALALTAAGHVPVHILAAPSLHPMVRECLTQAGATDAQQRLINLVDIEVDSVWIRDYGPDVVVGAAGDRRFVDMVYFPYAVRQCDDFLYLDYSDRTPDDLGRSWNVPVSRPPVVMPGGNLLTDGAGRCFRARERTNRDNCFAGWCYTEARTDAVIGQAHGCDVTTLESMQGGVIDHIDMWMSVLSAKTVLVGRYDVRDDAVNAAILDRNAQHIAALGYEVLRIPMPTPYCAKDKGWACVATPEDIQECDGKNKRVWATYLNSIRLGDLMAVPVYRWGPPSLAWRHHAQEQEALATYQWALDREFGAGAVKVVPIQSDALIPCQGSLHCLTKTFR